MRQPALTRQAAPVENAAMAQEFHAVSMPSRVAGGIARRCRAAWRQWRGAARRDHAERALDWLVAEIERALQRQRTLGADELRAADRTLRAFGETQWAERLQTGVDVESGWSSQPCRAVEVARQAIADFSLAQLAQADRALERLRRAQRPDGSWPFDPALANDPDGSILAACLFLQAQVEQVSAGLAAQGEPLDEIGDADGRWQALATWLDEAPPAGCVTEIGCGAGRYLRRILAEQADGRWPQARVLGVDPLLAALARLPRRATRVRGAWPRLPLADDACAAAFAIEALEHALAPRRAVAELCRIVRPGGRVLILDKHSAFQRLSLHEPWERWFEPEEVAGWLAAHCRDVEARAIGHGPHREPTGLFWCWTGVVDEARKPQMNTAEHR